MWVLCNVKFCKDVIFRKRLIKQQQNKKTLIMRKIISFEEIDREAIAQGLDVKHINCTE